MAPRTRRWSSVYRARRWSSSSGPCLRQYPPQSSVAAPKPSRLMKTSTVYVAVMWFLPSWSGPWYQPTGRWRDSSVRFRGLDTRSLALAGLDQRRTAGARGARPMKDRPRPRGSTNEGPPAFTGSTNEGPPAFTGSTNEGPPASGLDRGAAPGSTNEGPPAPAGLDQRRTARARGARPTKDRRRPRGSTNEGPPAPAGLDQRRTARARGARPPKDRPRSRGSTNEGPPAFTGLDQRRTARVHGARPTKDRRRPRGSTTEGSLALAGLDQRTCPP